MSDAQSKSEDKLSEIENKEEQSEADSDFNEGSIKDNSEEASNQESDVD